jgi:hypothetical protein
MIGCINFAKDFVVCGTATDKLFGVAESLWEPDLEPEDLFETISQTLMNAVDRDAFSGWGIVVHVMWVLPSPSPPPPQIPCPFVLPRRCQCVPGSSPDLLRPTTSTPEKAFTRYLKGRMD